MRVFGRIFSPDGELPEQLTIVGPGDNPKRVDVGADGRFLIDVRADRGAQTLTVERAGSVISEHLVDPGALDGELALEVPRPARPQRSAGALALDAALPQSTRERLLRPLAEQAGGLGIGEDRLVQTGRLFDELDELSRLGVGATLGDAGSLERLAAGIGGEIPFDFGGDLGRFKPGPGGPEFTDCRGLPSAPSAVIFGAALLDQQHGTDRLWVGRAVTAVLRRSEPAMRISRALDAVQGGLGTGHELVDALEFSARLTDPAAGPAPLHEQIARAGFGLRGAGGGEPTLPPGRVQVNPGIAVTPEGRTIRPGLRDPGRVLPGLGGGFPGPGGGFPDPGGGLPGVGGGLPLGGGLPERPGLGTLLDPCNLEWLNCIHTFYEAPPPRTPDPPDVAGVAPTDIAAGAATQLILTPATANGFGDAADPGWAILLGGTALRVASWKANEIVLDVPAMAPGCYELNWSIDLSGAASFFERQSAACAGFFGPRPRPPLSIPKKIDSVSVVGAPNVVGFKADGKSPKVVRLGCTAVTINWDVDRQVCMGTTAAFDLTVKDDTGTVIATGSNPVGTATITTDTDRTYTLEAANALPGQPRQVVTATLEVERVQAVSSLVVTPARPLKTGEAGTVTATLSCPADDDVVVTVTSDRPNRFPSVQIPIAAGQNSGNVQVNAGAACGKVNLSAVVSGVSGYPPAAAIVLVHNPRFDQIVSSNLEQCDGGDLAVRVSCALSASTVSLTGPAGSFNPTAQPQATASQPADVAAGTIQLSSHFGPLPAGSYKVTVFADGATLNGGQLDVPLGPPRVSISATPNVVQLCAETDVTVSAQATRATELSITKQGGSAVGAPKTGTNPCIGLDTQAVVKLSEATTFIALAERTGAASAQQSTTVAEGTNFAPYRSWVFVNKLPPKQAYDAAGKPVVDAQGRPVMLPRSMFVFEGKLSSQLLNRLTEVKPGDAWEYKPANCELFRLWITLVDNQFSTQDASLVLVDSGICLGTQKGIVTSQDVFQLPSLFPGP